MGAAIEAVYRTTSGGYHIIIVTPWESVQAGLFLRSYLGDDRRRIAYDRQAWKNPKDILFHVRRGEARVPLTRCEFCGRFIRTDNPRRALPGNPERKYHRPCFHDAFHESREEGQPP